MSRLTEAQYWELRQEHTTVSYGKLKRFSANPRKFRIGPQQKTTASMSAGNLLDCLMFTPGEFDSRFGILEYDDLRTKAAKEQRDSILTDGKIPVKKQEVTTAYSQLNAVLTTDVRPEPWRAIWTDRDGVTLNGEAQGGISRAVRSLRLNVVGKPDFAPAKDGPYGDCLVDLKLTAACGLDAWSRQVVNFAYHWQAAMYLDLYNAETGEERTRFLHLVVESEAPYDCGLVELSPDAIATGQVEYLQAMEDYAYCIRESSWPSAYSGPLDYGRDNPAPPMVSLPKWHQKKERDLWQTD